jgi:hypothetical protein
VLLLAWIINVGFVASFYCAAHALWDAEPGNPVPSLMQHFLIVPVGMVILMVPLFPGGAGIGELGFGAPTCGSSARRRTASWPRWWSG